MRQQFFLLIRHKRENMYDSLQSIVKKYESNAGYYPMRSQTATKGW
jgi:hypothetical protein